MNGGSGDERTLKMWIKFLVSRWLTSYLLSLEFQILSTNYQPLEVSSHSKPGINI